MPTLLTSTAITAVQLKEAASPGTPSSGYGRLYFYTDNTLHIINDAGTDIDLSGLYTGKIALTSQAAGDVITASSSSQLSRVAKGTAYQVFHMNAGATSGEWTSTLGVTGTRLTAGFFTDLTVTNAIAGSVTGTAATVTGATQASITTCANLVSVGTITTGVWNAGAVTSTGALTSSLSTAASAIVVNTNKFTVAGSTGNTVVAGTLTAAGDVGLAATKKLYLDGVAMTGDTYIQESAANTLSLYAGGAEALKLTTTGATFAGTVQANASITSGTTSTKGIFYLGSDTGAYIYRDGTAYYFTTTGATTFNYSIVMATWPTTASAANAYVSDGGVLSRSTSLRQYKDVGAAISYDEGIAVVRGLSAVHYTSKIATDEKRGMVGLIAEDVETVAGPLAQYNNGVLGGVAYDRVPMYLLPVVKQHDAELSALRARVAELEARVN